MLFVLYQSQAGADSNNYEKVATPVWAKPVTPFDPELEQIAEPTFGFHNRLDDFQFNGLEPGNSSYYNAIEYVLTNRYGVENYSTVELSFDPVYEKLSLHELTIMRGDTLIDKFPTARFDLLHTERDRAELVYDGTRTLAILLEDVRVGDVIRYAYTVEGENPIFQGNREFRVHTQLWNPLDRQHTRLLTTTDRPLNRRVRGADVPVTISENNGIQEIIIDQRGLAEFDLEDDVPSWHYNRGTIVFSDMPDWRSVVDWALPMYDLPESSVPEIVAIAEAIQSSNDGVAAQVGAALRWVQEEVRYFGVELGKNSHWPSRPDETLARRFGDCKDKVLLLIALLKEIGVEATPALVNTNRGLEAVNYPYRMHAFNHVIVHVVHDGVSHFIDPTLRNQSGALGDMFEPDYGRALLLDTNTIGLTKMGKARSALRLNVTKSLTVPRVVPSGAEQMPASLTVNTVKRGRLAELVRYRLETDGPVAQSEDYKNYYKDYFDDISTVKRATFTDGNHDTLQISEQYSITDLWMADANIERYRWLYADEIVGYLDEPEEVQDRVQPYELVHPVSIEETWVVSMAEPLRLDDLEAQISNAWVSFSKQSALNEDESELTVKFRYATLADEVSAEELQAYAESVEKIRDMASFYLEQEPGVVSVSKIATKIRQAGALNVTVLMFGLMFHIGRKISGGKAHESLSIR